MLTTTKSLTDCISEIDLTRDEFCVYCNSKDGVIYSVRSVYGSDLDLDFDYSDIPVEYACYSMYKFRFQVSCNDFERLFMRNKI